MNQHISIILKGMAMGVAEVIPGVSGGTIAFITGIYERLLSSIRAFGPTGLKAFQEEGVKGFWSAIDGNFILKLLIGMAIGFVSGIFVIGYLLEHYKEPLWGFFFGLILISCWVVGRMIKKWNPTLIGLLLFFTVATYYLVLLTPSEGSLNPLFVFFSGMIAISALMLPGISGSFILLLMGMYELIIPSVKRFLQDQQMEDFIIVLTFGGGCLVGLMVFARVLGFLFKKFHDPTFAILTGLMIGSLAKIWPWRNITSVLDKSTLEKQIIQNPEELTRFGKDGYKVLQEINVLPAAYAGDHAYVGLTVFSFLIGVAVVLVVVLGAERKSKDVEIPL